MNDSMVDRLDDNEPVTITEALEIPQPRAVGSPLPRGNGNRISVPPTYSDLEERPPSALGPILAPPPANFSFAPNPARTAAPAPAPPPEPLSVNIAPNAATAPNGSFAPNGAFAPSAAASLNGAFVPNGVHAPETASAPPLSAPAAAPLPAAPAPVPARQEMPERPAALQSARPQEQPSTLQRAAGMIRHAIPIVQKFLPLLDGNIATVVSNILSPPPPPAPPTALAPPPPQVRVDLTPLKEGIAELQVSHKHLLDQVSEQNNSLKRVEDHLELVREATDRNTLEQQELMEDLKSMGSKVNVVAAIAIGLLAISLLVNMVLYMHIQRVLP